MAPTSWEDSATELEKDLQFADDEALLVLPPNGARLPTPSWLYTWNVVWSAKDTVYKVKRQINVPLIIATSLLLLCLLSLLFSSRTGA